MIRIAAEYFFLCALSNLHPTIFVDQEGACVAVCDKTCEPHGCYDADGQPLTECFDSNGKSQLCDAYVYALTPDDYDIIEK